MNVGTSIEEEVRELLKARTPLAPERAALSEDLRLGAGGLGLDSISLVELLLDCERRFGVSPAELLAGEEPLTIGCLLAAVRTATGLAAR
jgi:acyl carrier protein